MAEATAIVETTVMLKLTQDEARWLHDITQNYLGGEFGSEAPREQAARVSIFQALHGQLFVPVPRVDLYDDGAPRWPALPPPPVGGPPPFHA